MFYLSLVLTLLSVGILIICIRRNMKLNSKPYVMGELIQTDLMLNESSNIYEATYRYNMDGKTKIYISDKKHRNPKLFDNEVKLYYNNKKQVYEKPSDEILVVSLISTILCLLSTIIFSILA